MDDPPLPMPVPPPAHPDSNRLAGAMRRCLPLATRLTGIIYRVASVRRTNAADLIAGIGSQLTGGRWTPPGAFRACMPVARRPQPWTRPASRTSAWAFRPGWPCPWW